jgi:hypothetical protein
MSKNKETVIELTEEQKQLAKQISTQLLENSEKDTRILKVIKYFEDILDLEKRIESTVEKLQKMNSMQELQFYPHIDVRRLCMDLKHIEDSIKLTHENLHKLFHETEDMFFPSKIQRLKRVFGRGKKE